MAPISNSFATRPVVSLVTALAGIAGIGAVLLFQFPRLTPRGSGSLHQEAYVWQRAWTEAVKESISLHGSNFLSVVPLAAEVAWQERTPKVTRVPVDFRLLTANSERIGAALRIGPYPGPFHPSGEPLDSLLRVAESIVSDASAHDARLTELHIDFDCADSQLEGYQRWVESMRERLSPVRIVITALPSWLNESTFRGLAETADGYILQVHSLRRPGRADSTLEICNVEQAIRWVEQAARIGVPFRVALPTYGYLAAFDALGEFLGASAENPNPLWPEGTVVREMRADPTRLANLVRHWKASRPAALSGIIWYRMPVASDRLNWAWPTLAAVMEGRAPSSHWKTSIRGNASGSTEGVLAEIILENDGERDLGARPRIRVRWTNGRVIAGDGLNGYELETLEDGLAAFAQSADPAPETIRAGESRIVGWLRLDIDNEETIYAEEF